MLFTRKKTHNYHSKLKTGKKPSLARPLLKK